MKLTSTEIRTHLRTQFPNLKNGQIQSVDGDYAVPTRRWLEHTFVPYFQSYKAAYGVEFWTKEEFDCDDFALCFAAEARKAHHRSQSPDKPKDCTLSVGFMHFTSHGSGGIGEGYHAACVAVVWNQETNEQETLTLEPQNGWTTQLKPEERQSCDFVYM